MHSLALGEEQFISIYLSALKLGLFKADKRHLYAGPTERMNSPVSPSLPCANPLLLHPPFLS